MEFEFSNSLFFSDTNIPDVFITEYLPTLPAEQVKLYLYIAFLSEKKKKIKLEDLCAKLSLKKSELDELLLRLEAVGLLTKNGSRIQLQDIKEKELLRIYQPKQNVKVAEAIEHTEKNENRNRIISMINNRFFQGLMSPQWFVDIDTWFEKFGFEPDLMYALFLQCYDAKKFNRAYIFAIAQTWATEGIKTMSQLERYNASREQLMMIEKKVAKKLRKQTSAGYYGLNEYELEYLRKWVLDYGFGYDVIEYMLKRSVNRMNVGFSYFDAIMKEWHNAEVITLEEVQLYEQHSKKDNKTKADKMPRKSNKSTGQPSFEKRGYDKQYIEDLVEKL